MTEHQGPLDDILSILLTTHLDRHAKPLHDLIASHADDVNSDNFLLGTYADKLVHGRLFVCLV